MSTDYEEYRQPELAINTVKAYMAGVWIEESALRISLETVIEQAKRAQELQAQLDEIKIVKWKNGRPTAIDWNGERWVYEPSTKFKGGSKNGKKVSPHS